MSPADQDSSSTTLEVQVQLTKTGLLNVSAVIKLLLRAVELLHRTPTKELHTLWTDQMALGERDFRWQDKTTDIADEASAIAGDMHTMHTEDLMGSLGAMRWSPTRVRALLEACQPTRSVTIADTPHGNLCRGKLLGTFGDVGLLTRACARAG